METLTALGHSTLCFSKQALSGTSDMVTFRLGYKTASPRKGNRKGCLHPCVVFTVTHELSPSGGTERGSGGRRGCTEERVRA